MKKFLLVLVCLVLLVGCNKTNKEKTTEKKDSFVLEKIDKEKDWVYLTKYKSLNIWNKDRNINIITINVASEAVENVNLELKNFVVNSVNKYEIYDNRLIVGNVIDYDYYVSDNYITVIQRYFMTSDDMVGDKHENVYVISLKDGKRIDNDEIRKIFKISEEDLYKKIEAKLDNKDVDYWMSLVKKNGYKLYINDKDNLCVVFDIATDDEVIKKELVLN